MGWTMKHFLEQRLPWMEEVYEEWEALVWGDTFHMMNFCKDVLEQEKEEELAKREEERKKQDFISYVGEEASSKQSDASLWSAVFGAEGGSWSDWVFGNNNARAKQNVASTVKTAADKFKKSLKPTFDTVKERGTEMMA